MKPVAVRSNGALESILVLVLAALPGCGNNRPIVGDPKPPAYEPRGETKCHLVTSHSEPLVVEWNNNDRAKLESLSQRGGLVVVNYEGCSMKLLPRCSVAGGYKYHAVQRKREALAIRNAEDLWANLPAGAAQLQGKLANGGELEVRTSIVGRYETELMIARDQDLGGDCGGASHVITSLTVGAFVFSAKAALRAEGGASVMGAGAGGSSSSEKQTLTSDGDETACAVSKQTDPAPPDNCGAPIRIELLPIARGKDLIRARLLGLEQQVDRLRTTAGAVLAELKRSDDAAREGSCKTNPQPAIQAADEIRRELAAVATEADDLAKDRRTTPDDAPEDAITKLEKRSNDAKEKVWRTKARTSLLLETVLGAAMDCKTRARMTVASKNDADLVSSKQVFVVDGAVVYSRADDAALPKETPIFDGKTPAGRHEVTATLELRDPKRKGDRYVVKTHVPFTTSGAPLAVVVRTHLRPPVPRASLADRLAAEIMVDGTPSPDTETQVSYSRAP